MTIKIFKSEIDDGIGDLIQSSASIAYVSELKSFNPSPNIKKLMAKNLDKSTATNQGQEDLYYMDSVLVTTCWNKNDDVFDADEVWAARNTPEDKPFNLEHDEKAIIGHITANWPVHKDGSVIPDDTAKDSLPEEFHIITSSVIYKNWSDPEFVIRTQELIDEIEQGNKFVSMECLFRGFDYAIMSPDGTEHVIARNEESSFLTKYLKAYGGDGSYENYKIGRLLRTIAFCGKGLVDKPANPSSIIFDKYNSFTQTSSEGIELFSLLQNSDSTIAIAKESMMTDANVDIYKDQVDGLKNELTEAREEVNTTRQEMAEKSKAEMQAQLESFEATVADKDEKLAQYEAELGSRDETIAELQETVTKLGEEKEAASAELSEIKNEQKLSVRKAALLAAGLGEDEAQETVEKLAELSDEQFDVIASIVPAPVAKEETDEVSEEVAEVEVVADATEDEAEEVADATDLDDVEVEDEADLSAAGEDTEDKTEVARTALSDMIAEKFLNI